MFSFIDLLCFSEFLAAKFLFLNDEPCMVRPTIIGLNSVEFKYYPFMISLDKCIASLMSFLQRYVFQKNQVA